MNEEYVCPKCGSNEIEGKAWANLNDPKAGNVTFPDSFDDENDFWCMGCQSHIIPKIKEI